VFAASAETIRRESGEFDLRRSVGNRQDLAACACVIFMFFPRRRFLGRRSLVIFCGREVLFFPIYCEQIRDHLSSYGQGRSIGIPFLLRCFIDQSQIVILSERQLRGFDQHPLDMLVARFGKRGAHHFVGGAFFLSAEPAIEPGLVLVGRGRRTALIRPLFPPPQKN
jgi:hypothetical protein